MSTGLDADLALVAACRDVTDDNTFVARLLTPALSLVEDILNRHRFGYEYVSRSGTTTLTACHHCDDEWPCVDHTDALTALHAIAEALGIDPE